MLVHLAKLAKQKVGDEGASDSEEILEKMASVVPGHERGVGMVLQVRKHEQNELIAEAYEDLE